MDSEQDVLLQLLFSKGEPGHCNVENIFDYIHKVGEKKVEDLLKEPNRLQYKQLLIREQIQDLALTNYKTFIETAQCSRELFTQSNLINSKLDKLLIDIPEFERKSKVFTEKTSGINNLRTLNSLTLTRNIQLLEILELPQLMNSFIRDGSYEDALELAGYVRKLYNKHPDIKVLKSIVDDIDKTWLLMFHQLLAQLKQDLSLPKCLLIVGYLRQMNEFTETELRLKFLQARNTFLISCLNAVSRQDVSYHLNKTIEVTRVNLFNIINQYKAIFNDDEHSPFASTRHYNANQNVIFFSWLQNKISEFLSTVEQDLLNGASPVDTLLSQCMYFGLSFSKVGCDFRSLLIPIFTKRIINSFNYNMDKVISNFEKNMERFTLITKNHSNISWKNKNNNPVQAPESLIEFYPLAEFLNNILVSLNELKLCAPIGCLIEVVKSLQKALLVVAKSITILHGQEQQAFTSNSKEAFFRLCICFSDDLIPYIQKCLHIMFPPTIIACNLGISVQNLQTLGISFLDKKLILEPIKHLLPTKTQSNMSDVENNVNDDMYMNSDNRST